MDAIDDVALMRMALDLAQEALDAGDEPYGAVIVAGSGTVGERNRVVTADDPTAHSEVMAIRVAVAQWGAAAVRDSVMVTSFEPCPMCLGSIVEAGVRAVVIGARRTVGAGPLGDYTVEALLGLMGRTDDLTVGRGPLASEAAEFYARLA